MTQQAAVLKKQQKFGVKSVGPFVAIFGGIAMTAVLIFGAAAGIGLGLARFKVLALLPAILIVAAGTFGSGLATSLEFRFIGIAVPMAVASLQIAYLVGFLAVGFIVTKYLRARAMSNV